MLVANPTLPVDPSRPSSPCLPQRAPHRVCGLRHLLPRLPGHQVRCVQLQGPAPAAAEQWLAVFGNQP